MKFLKTLGIVLCILALVIVLITITSGPWLINAIGDGNIAIGKGLKTVGKFLDFFGIGG